MFSENSLGLREELRSQSATLEIHAAELRRRAQALEPREAGDPSVVIPEVMQQLDESWAKLQTEEDWTVKNLELNLFMAWSLAGHFFPQTVWTHLGVLTVIEKEKQLMLRSLKRAGVDG